MSQTTTEIEQTLIGLGILVIIGGAMAWRVIKDGRLMKRQLAQQAAAALEKANQGDVEGMMVLADIEGEDSSKWLEAAAEKGHVGAMMRLADGHLFEKSGEPLWRKDEPKAFEYYHRAAMNGHERAMRDVATCYLRGEGVLKNIGEATRWRLRSAELGSVASQVAVSAAYLEGYGVKVNGTEGLAWLYVAEFRGSSEAKQKLAAVEELIGNENVLKAQNRAKELMELCKEGKSTRETAGFAPLVIDGKGKKPETKPSGSGSGTIVSGEGHVLTAAHVLKGARFIEVVTVRGTVAASVLTLDEANDLALLKMEGQGEPHLEVRHSRSVRLGQKVATIGFPNIGIQGHSPKVTEGLVSGESGAQNDVRMWQVSVPIQPGNSGGPLLDEGGAVVGVVVASLSLEAIKATGAVPQNVNYAVKSAYVEPLLSQHGLPMDMGGINGDLRFEDMIVRARKSSVLVLVF